MASRRHILSAGGVLLAGLFFPAGFAIAAGAVAEIRMKSDLAGAHVGFDPVGLLIEPGTAIRWISEANTHTTTAYHPSNSNHSLRIPKAAKPWHSDYLNPGEHFETVLTVPGVYDYFCEPHELAGMVGRIVVGTPIGPGSLPFDYFKNLTEGKDWMPVPDMARKVFPPIAEIMQKKIVPGKPIKMGMG